MFFTWKRQVSDLPHNPDQWGRSLTCQIGFGNNHMRFLALLALMSTLQAAPGLFRVQVETTAGDFTIEVHRDWAPHGADRFYDLIRAKYYDDSRFFRVVAGKWVQFGIAGNSKIAR